MIKPILTLDRYAEVDEAATVFHDRVVKILIKLHRRNPEHYCIRNYRIKFNQELVWLEGTCNLYETTREAFELALQGLDKEAAVAHKNAKAQLSKFKKNYWKRG